MTPSEFLGEPHCIATRQLLTERLKLDFTIRSLSAGPARMLLEKTMAYLTALHKRGCGFLLSPVPSFTSDPFLMPPIFLTSYSDNIPTSYLFSNFLILVLFLFTPDLPFRPILYALDL